MNSRLKAKLAARGYTTRGYVPAREHFPVMAPPPAFGWLSRTYAKDGLIVRTRSEAQHVAERV